MAAAKVGRELQQHDGGVITLLGTPQHLRGPLVKGVACTHWHSRVRNERAIARAAARDPRLVELATICLVCVALSPRTCNTVV